MTAAVPLIHVYAIRDVAESLYRRGDLGYSQRSMISAQDGQRIHRQWKKTRPKDWCFEAPVGECCTLHSGIQIQLSGRADGIGYDNTTRVIEEVKTVRPAQLVLLRQAEVHHAAQCRLYAALIKPEGPVELRVTYVDVDTGNQKTFREKADALSLAHFLEETLERLHQRIVEQQSWHAKRSAAIAPLAFPYPRVRPGQDLLMDRVAHTLNENDCALLEAPTGIGKTMGTLYPALRQWTQRADTLFYLTAKNTGKQLAEQALSDLRQAGAHVRSITLTAKADFNCVPGIPCDTQCPGALGFFDRLQEALQAMRIETEAWTPERILHMARRHQICPFEFSLFLAEWADVILCDYNYVFDPRARLRRFFDKPRGTYVFLIDEVHNLPERGRDMLSSSLSRRFLRSCAQQFKTNAPLLHQALSRLGREFTRIAKRGTSPMALAELPASLVKQVRQSADHCELLLVEEESTSGEEVLLELYFALLDFLSAADSFAETHRLLYEKEGRQERLKIFCLDPSLHLAAGLQRARAVVGFSATLMPPSYYTRMLGMADQQPVFRFPSPFPPKHLQIEIETSIRTTYQHRAASIAPLADRLAAFLSVDKGNYLVFFPSYAFMKEVQQALAARAPFTCMLTQEPGMSAEERSTFLDAFRKPADGLLVGFAVMGGVFGEGIDLVGEQLTGAVIVGAGLPQLGFERQLIRHHFDEQGESGFDMAYTWPGWTRVAQAAGRIIRSETDTGRLLLVDHRFAWPLYRRLFPPHWQI